MALLSLLTRERRWVMACYFILLKQQQQSRFTHRKTTLFDSRCLQIDDSTK